jgi:hypothetical protein
LGRSHYAWSFKIVTDRAQHHPAALEANADQALTGAKKVNLEGHDQD